MGLYSVYYVNLVLVLDLVGLFDLIEVGFGCLCLGALFGWFGVAALGWG